MRKWAGARHAQGIRDGGDGGGLQPRGEEVALEEDAEAAAGRAEEDADAERRFRETFPEASADAIDMLIHLMHFEPHKRITAQQALEHPWMASGEEEVSV